MSASKKDKKASYSKMTAQLYDEIYAWKNYQEEAQCLQRIIDSFCQAQPLYLLDVACGTGSHLSYLPNDYHITGLDNSQEQINHARSKLPKIKFLEADMIDFQLPQSFDVITCMFGSIAYSQTLAKMSLVAQNLAQHLKPGGLLIVEPFVYKSQYRQDLPSARFVDKPDLKVARLFTSKREGDLAVWDLHHLVANSSGVDYFVEHHKIGLFEKEQYCSVLEQSGFQMEEIPAEVNCQYNWLLFRKPTN